MALSETQLEKSRAHWVAEEKKAKAAEEKAAARRKKAHEMHEQRDRELAALRKPKVSPPLKTVITDAHGFKPGHDGVDLICPPNEPALAMCKAKVVRVSAAGWWGSNATPSPGHPVGDGDGIIIIESLVDAGPIRKGLHFCYGHAEHATVKVGDTVQAGQVIGKAGFARAWHLHFMVNDDKPVNGVYRGVGDRDPKPYLDYAEKNA